MAVQMRLDEVNDEYKQFVDKFKPKKTTDDCYTPEIVYDAVKSWVLDNYEVGEIVRPFWPGGDYERFDYPQGCVVLDNPPFSILTEIVNFYNENGIGYFLFAPYLTNFSTGHKCCHIISASAITYENGAKVATSFVTNLDDRLVVGSPELCKLIEQADEINRKEKTKTVPKYDYPDNIVMASDVGYMAKHSVQFELEKNEALFIRKLDSQTASGKALFGGGFLVSDEAATRRAAAERAAAERAAAERAAATKWPLSEREKEIIRRLNK